jgi:hypothetical protein
MTDYPYGTTSAPPSTFGDQTYTQHDDSPSVKDRASESMEAGKQAAGEVAQTATEKAKDVADETKRQARDLIAEARTQLSSQVEAQHRSLVDNLRALADELSGMASRGTEGGGVATDLVSQAGERAHGVADWLDRRQPGDMVAELRSFARQRPGTFLVGAAVAGVLAGRLTRGAVAAHGADSSASSPQLNGSPATTTNEYAAPAPAAPPAETYAGSAGQAYPGQTGGAYPTTPGSPYGDTTAYPAGGYASGGTYPPVGTYPDNPGGYSTGTGAGEYGANSGMPS